VLTVIVAAVVVMVAAASFTPLLDGTLSTTVIVSGGPAMDQGPPPPPCTGPGGTLPVRLAVQNGPVITRVALSCAGHGRVRLPPGIFVVRSGPGCQASGIVVPFRTSSATLVCSAP
jgi:hypothetical protein